MPKKVDERVRRVCDLFEDEKIDIDMVASLADKSSYWSNASDFATDNWLKLVETLSDKQQEWLLRIVDDVTEMRIEGKI